MGNANKERTSVKVQSERAVLAAVRLPESQYDQRDPFGELRALAEQAGAIIVGELEQRLQRPIAGTFMGSGKVEELKRLCDALNATLVIFDHDLSPSQLKNIEEVVGRKIVDRSELILDIFASRATTHEAKLQVEMAQLEYTYPRLRAMWDHLERIVGGAGGVAGIGTRGPGEQQLEIDRRLVQKRKLALKRELDEIHARKRRLVRDRRREHFTVCLVGYTNAGKSTLFNTLTAGGAYADDRVFATLITRTRAWDVGSDASLPAPADADAQEADAEAPPEGEATSRGGLEVMLSDTVGFVRDLPHHLVASFRATLEEATHADLLLIMLDVSDPAAELHYDTVMSTLDDLLDEARELEEREGNVAPDLDDDEDGPAAREGFHREDGQPDTRTGDRAWRPPDRILLLNKVDRLADNRDLLVWQRKHPGAIAISARDPSDPGVAELRRLVREAAQGGVTDAEITLPLRDGKTLLRLESRAQVFDRQYDLDTVTLRVRIGRRQLDQLRSTAGGRLTVRPWDAPVPPSAPTAPPASAGTDRSDTGS